MRSKTKKLIWAAPLLAVFAVAAALAIFAVQPPGAALAHDLPGTPGDVTATAANGNTAVDVSWSKPTTGGAPTGYRIDRSEDGNEWFTLVANTDNTKVTYRDSDVKRSKTYYYRVFAINSAGIGPVAKDDFATIADAAAPSVPRQVNATAMSQNKIVLTWLPPAKDGGSTIAKYRIWVWSENATDLSAVTGVPNASPGDADTTTTPNSVTDGLVEVDHDSETEMQSYEHLKARAGTRYLYKVMALTDSTPALTSPISDSEDAETDALTKPKAPTQLRAVQSADGTIQLYWSAPTGTDTGGADISGYRVQAAVKADNASFGPYADQSGAYTGDTTVHDASYTIAAPTTTDKVGFRVYSQTGDASATPSTLLESDGYASVTVTVLTTTTRTKQIHTAPIQPQGASGVIPTATRDAFKNVTVKWGAPTSLAATGGPTTVSGYMIDVSDDGVAWSRLQRSTGRTSNQYFYIDTEVKARHYRVFAWNGGQLGPAASTGESGLGDGPTIAAPSAVRNLTATPNGPTQIDLSWDEPSNLGNAPIKRYNIQARMKGATDTANDPAYTAWPAANAAAGTTPADADSGPIVVIHTKDGKTTTYSHTKLKAGETWQYRVLALNETPGQGGADPTPNVSAVGAVVKSAKTAQESKPEKPEGLTAEDAKDSSNQDSSDRGVLLQWNAPNPPDGAELSSYSVERMVNNGDWETLNADTGSTDTNYTDEEEPKEGEMRAYRVAAISSGDVMGDWSDTAYYPQAGHTHIEPVGTIPAQSVAVAGPAVTVDATKYFTGATSYAAASSDATVASTPATAIDGMVTITAVGIGTATITVTASDASGTSATQTIDVTVTSGDLMAPTNVTATSNAAGVLTLTWEGGENADKYILLAVDMTNHPGGPYPYDRSGVNDPMARTGNITGLSSGTSYLGIVIAVKGEGTDMMTLHGSAAAVPVQ